MPVGGSFGHEGVLVKEPTVSGDEFGDRGHDAMLLPWRASVFRLRTLLWTRRRDVGLWRTLRWDRCQRRVPDSPVGNSCSLPLTGAARRAAVA